MKNNLIVIFLVLSSCLLYSQNQLKINKEGLLTPNQYTELLKEKGLDGISKFDTISYNPLLIYAGTLKNNRIGLIDHYGKKILENDYIEIRGIYNTFTGLPGYHDNLLLRNDKGWALSDNKGKIKTPFEYRTMKFEEYKIVEKRRNSSQQKYPWSIMKDSIIKAYVSKGSYIFLNTKGQKIDHKERPNFINSPEKPVPGNNGIPLSIGVAKHLTGNLYQIKIKKDKDRYGVYDKSLKKIIIPTKFNYVSLGEKLPFLKANADEGQYAYDFKGNLLLKEPANMFTEIGNGKNSAVIVYGKKGKQALFSKNFKPITDFKYDFIRYSDYLVQGVINKDDYSEKTHDIMDLEGKKIKFDIDYDEVIFKTNNYNNTTELFIFLKKKDKLAIVNTEGKIISDFIYDEILAEAFVASDKPALYEDMLMIANHPNYFIYFKKDGKYGIMDNNYKIIADNIYDMMTESIIDSFVYIKKNSKWGVYDVANRREIITPQFDTHITNSSQFFIVKKDGKFGIYDTSGKEIIPIKYNYGLSAEKLFEGMYCFYKKYDEPIAYLDSMGNIIWVENDQK